MIILILIILIILITICAKKAEEEIEYWWFLCTVVLIVLSIVVGIVFIGLVCEYPYNIDQKLEMYAEENENIEAKVKQTVQAYMNYEQETYKDLIETADLQTIIMTYPELNSNELVGAEIETYKENNNKIKELKEKAIDKKVMGFWYFFNIGVKD